MKLKKDFHKRLFGFAGFSGSGKTTLIEKIITGLSHYEIGYIKHDAHKFQIDHAGKDTYRQFAAGARMVYINDPHHYAMQARGESFSLEKEFFRDCDLVIVEGHKYSDHPKFLFLDEEGEAEKEYREGKIREVIGTISSGPTLKKLDQLPAFHRDDVKGFCTYFEEKIHQSTKAQDLYALVLVGGQSSRMGQDKAMLNYHGRPQALHLYELLEKEGLKTFLSCRHEQDAASFQGYSLISDRFLNFGPLGGILSAMTEHPDKAFLVVACDLPLVNSTHIKELLAARAPLKQACAYFNGERKMFEPLFAIYEPSIYTRLLHFLGERMTCPQKVLFNSSVKRLELPRQDFLFNANTPEEGQLAIRQLEQDLCR